MDSISAMMDGELDSDQAQRELARVKQDAELRDRWDTYHLIGDALKREPLLSSGFNAALAQKLSQEPTVLAPKRYSTPSRRVTYALTAAASLAAVAFVASVAFSPN